MVDGVDAAMWSAIGVVMESEILFGESLSSVSLFGESLSSVSMRDVADAIMRVPCVGSLLAPT